MYTTSSSLTEHYNYYKLNTNTLHGVLIVLIHHAYRKASGKDMHQEFNNMHAMQAKLYYLYSL